MLIEQRVRELKEIIAANDGRNAADRRFSRAVDELLAEAFAGISKVSRLPARTLFDLLVIKVLYVGRDSRDASVVDYIGGMLEACIDARKLFPPDDSGRPRRLYFSDLLEPERRPAGEPDIFEAYRRYADSALFLAGIFAPSLTPRLRAQATLRRGGAAGIDAAYYVATGKRMYEMASRHHHRTCAHEPRTLATLGTNFELYAEALREMSERYIMGFDLGLIADHMLDAMNAGRPADAERYRALLD